MLLNFHADSMNATPEHLAATLWKQVQMSYFVVGFIHTYGYRHNKITQLEIYIYIYEYSYFKMVTCGCKMEGGAFT